MGGILSLLTRRHAGSLPQAVSLGSIRWPPRRGSAQRPARSRMRHS